MKRRLALIMMAALLVSALGLHLTTFAEQAKLPVTSLDRLAQPGITIAVGIDTPAEESLKRDYPEAKLIPYSDIFLAYLDVANGRIDACVNARREVEFAIEHGLTGVRLLDENYAVNKIAVGISPVSTIPDLKGRLNAFIAEKKADGTLDDMYDRWVTRGEERMPDIPEAERPSFTLRVGTTGTVMPYSYYVGTELAGYDIELARRFAHWIGARLEFKVIDFGGIIAAAETGSIDCIMSNLFYSEEKDEAIPFSDVLFEVEITAAVRDDGQTAQSAAAGDRAGTITKASLNSPRAKIGIPISSAVDVSVEEEMPKATVVRYNDNLLGFEDVASGRLDAYIYDEDPLKLNIENGLAGVRLLDEVMNRSLSIRVGISPVSEIPDLEARVNQFIGEMNENGTIEDMRRRWVWDAERTLPQIELPENPQYHLVVATTGVEMPYSYYEGTELTGFDIEMAYRFAAWLGADLQFEVYDYSGIVPATVTGKADVIMANLQYTQERAEAGLIFSDELYPGRIGILVRDDGEAPTADAAAPAWQAYNGKRLGVLTGPLMEDAAAEYFPDSEPLLFNSYPDCIAALRAGKIDAYLADGPSMKTIHAEQPEIDYIPDMITRNDYCFAFRKNDPESAALCAELNDFLSRNWADGTMDELDDIWFGVDEDKKVVDMSDLTGENGTIRVVTTSTDMPFSYIKDGKNVGYDIDLVVRFCRDRGYALELGDVDFAGRIPAIESGKYDFTTDMNVTPERQEQVLFSDPTSYGGIVLAVLSSDLAKPAAPAAAEAKDTPFWDGIAASFHKTFIREGRWRLFVEGVVTTLLITLFSILCGTLLGFAVFMLCRNGNPAANLVTRFCLWLVQGMPMVVLLMILYYVIFGSVAISGVAVAVIGFTLTFGAAVFGLLKMGVGAVDNGQYEAAYALGYSNLRTFFRIILPQALPHVLPAYRGEIVGLIKATAIVGYIAVQDLTKMGDVVRSRTYEAFFPLIAVTVIYFVLEGLIGFLVSRISVNFNPKRRKPADILKGVKTDD